jgi:hypothetical protein
MRQPHPRGGRANSATVLRPQDTGPEAPSGVVRRSKRAIDKVDQSLTILVNRFEQTEDERQELLDMLGEHTKMVFLLKVLALKVTGEEITDATASTALPPAFPPTDMASARLLADYVKGGLSTLRSITMDLYLENEAAYATLEKVQSKAHSATERPQAVREDREDAGSHIRQLLAEVTEMFKESK